ILVKNLDCQRKALVKIFSFIEEKFSKSDRLKNSALASFEYLDSSNRVMMPDEGLAISPAVGSYKYLSANPGKIAETIVEINIPKGCSVVRISLVAWSNEVDVYLKDEPYID